MFSSILHLFQFYGINTQGDKKPGILFCLFYAEA